MDCNLKGSYIHNDYENKKSKLLIRYDDFKFRGDFVPVVFQCSGSGFFALRGTCNNEVAKRYKIDMHRV